MKRKLSKEQDQEIFDLITRRRPFHLGLKMPSKNKKPFLWSRYLLAQLIQQKFEVTLSDAVVVNYLSRWGFPTVNRDKSKLDQCHVAIREWWVENGEVTVARSRNENATIYWMGDIEEIGLDAIELSRSKKLTMTSLIENQGRMHWLVISGIFNVKRQVMLLNSLVSQTNVNTKVFLIRKTSTHFKSKLVKDWLKANKTKIEIFPPLETVIQDSRSE
jgi:hypothetical protein